MPPLLKIRSERDQMSAIERRIADFLLENAHLLRDYSSQQLADALKISQSSVVKFSQKLGFKGYPDLKYSVGEAVARSTGGETTRATRSAKRDTQAALAESLWASKARAEEETRLINAPDKLATIANTIDRAGKVFLIGSGDDGVAAQMFAMQLSSLAIVAIHHSDPLLMAASISTAGKGDVLVMLCEHGQHHAISHLSRQFRERGGKSVSVTRHTANPLRAHADMALLVSAHDERTHIEPLLYQSALLHLLDLLFVLLCEEGDDRLAKLGASRERGKQLGES
ncbi:MAG TPA: MurR/RpiR family transcriptional regulator [Steroidobacteraceae bacterium]|jgi:DNA-binding MurR/RpiR family transcriptional regulator